MTHIFTYLPPAVAALALAGCMAADEASDTDPASELQQGGDSAAGTRPAGSPALVTVEGRVKQGVECLILRTPDGDVWSFNAGEADFGPGDYVELTGEEADASFCQQGRGTLVPQRIEARQPPARDRDPARAGGIRLSESYVTGNWTAKGVDADCARPDFQISRSPGALVIETSVNGTPETGRVVLGDYPRVDWDEPLPDMPLESRGPDGLAVLRPATDAAYDPISVGGHPIAGDGVVFVKCA